MGFSMVTLLIAVQTSVPRNQLGIATSGTVFFRSIGGAVGVAVMGAVLSTQMNSQAAQLSELGSLLPPEKLMDLLRHPRCAIEPGGAGAASGYLCRECAPADSRDSAPLGICRRACGGGLRVDCDALST
jgi:hypothetical protein